MYEDTIWYFQGYQNEISKNFYVRLSKYGYIKIKNNWFHILDYDSNLFFYSNLITYS